MFPVYITLSGDTVREHLWNRLYNRFINRIRDSLSKSVNTDDYHIWVSGYNAQLDSASIFRKTIYVTEK